MASIEGARPSGDENPPYGILIVDDEEAILESLGLMKATLPTTIEIQTDIPEDSGMVLADPTQLHQVLINISAGVTSCMFLTQVVFQPTYIQLSYQDI